MSSVKGLLQHCTVRATIRISLIGEHLAGWWKFVQWLPRLVSSALGGQFNQVPNTARHVFRRDHQLPAFFINLDARGDRKQETLNEFARLSLPEPTRFPAVVDEYGGLGCSKSHRDLVERLISEKAGITMICEDDVEFRGNREQIAAAIEEFERIPGLGVLCLAYRARGPRLPITRKLAVSNNIQMAACYVVKPFAFEPLRESFQSSVNHLKQGRPWSKFANDQLWKNTQTHEVFFCIPHTPLAWQRESFSDIAERTKLYL